MIDIFDNQFTAQAIGIVASGFIIGSFAQKSDKNFKTLLIVGALFFCIHYALMGAYFAACVAVINSLRTFLSMKYHRSNKLMYIFITIYIVAAIASYDKIYDVLPILAGILSTYAVYQLHGIKMRISFFFAEGSWMLFSTIIGSIGGIITNIFVLLTNSITTYRLLKDSKNGQNT